MPQSKLTPVNAATRLCAVLGSPIGHSASPAMHSAAYAALGLNWRYLAFEVNPDNLRAAIEGARAMNFVGLNLTVPHKLLAVDMVDELDVSAKVWGAVNTIRFEGRTTKSDWLPLREFGHEAPVEIRSHGFNTDADGLAASLREDLGVDLRGKKVLLLGVGGAGRTAALKLASENVLELFLVNRTFSKVLEVQQEIKKKFPLVYVGQGYPETEVDLVINATSLGLKPEDALPLDEKQFSLKQAGAVYDMIYRPAETKLLAAAKAAGCRTANGIGMLVHQGAKAFEIWTGQPAPVAVMRRAVEGSVYGL
ncbi:MAG: shikimate dehydrogenase [Verrucomicrobiota bacterium]